MNNPLKNLIIMKKLFLFLAGLGLLAALVGCLLGLSAETLFAATRLKGSGKITARTLTVPAFDAVEASRAVKVNIVATDEKTIRIDADDNLLDKVVVEVKKRTLHVSVDKSVREISNADITVTVPYDKNLWALEANSAARICCEEPLVDRSVVLEASSAATIRTAVAADKCRLAASSAAKIVAEVNARECEVDASSAAKIEVTGAATHCEADLSSAAKYRAADFTVEKYEIEASSSASARIRCTGSLDAEASSGASIRYAGDCRTTISRSSGGSVRAAEE